MSRVRFTALTPELQAGAVSSGVAKRLHKGGAHLSFTPGEGHPRDGVNSAPQHLRLDLARALGPNGRVATYSIGCAQQYLPAHGATASHKTVNAKNMLQ